MADGVARLLWKTGTETELTTISKVPVDYSKPDIVRGVSIGATMTIAGMMSQLPKYATPENGFGSLLMRLEWERFPEVQPS